MPAFPAILSVMGKDKAHTVCLASPNAPRGHNINDNKNYCIRDASKHERYLKHSIRIVGSLITLSYLYNIGK